MEQSNKIRSYSEILSDILCIVKGKAIEKKAELHHNDLSEIKLKKTKPRMEKLKRISKGLKLIRDRINELIEEYDKTIELYEQIREG